MPTPLLSRQKQVFRDQTIPCFLDPYRPDYGSGTRSKSAQLVPHTSKLILSPQAASETFYLKASDSDYFRFFGERCFIDRFKTAGYDNGSGGRMRSPGPRGYYGGGGGGGGGRGPPPGRPYKVLCVSELHPKASDDVIRDTLYR